MNPSLHAPARPREWAAIYVAILRKPKYRRLSPAGRGALLHLWVNAGGRSPEACWPDRAALLEDFELDGFDASHIDELIALRWLDVEPNGSHVVHDWDEWQMAASLSVRREWEAARKREWRRTKRATSPAPPPQDSNNYNHSDSNRSPVRVPDTSGTEVGGTKEPTREPLDDETTWSPEWLPFIQEWHRRFRYPPTEAQRTALWPVIDARPHDAARWLNRAPSQTKASDVVGFVLDRWREFRSAA